MWSYHTCTDWFCYKQHPYEVSALVYESMDTPYTHTCMMSSTCAMMQSHTKEPAMKASAQFRSGLIKASKVTGITARDASLKAGFNENQINRFVSGKTDIKLGTLEKVCTDGFGLPLDTVFRMGE